MSIIDIIKGNPYFKDSRLNSLYSNFTRLKELNPEGYEANIEAWSHLLKEIILSRELRYSSLGVRFKNPSLANLLAIPIYGKPDALVTVENELVERKVLVSSEAYEQLRAPFQIESYLAYLLASYASPLRWLEWGIGRLSIGGKTSLDRTDIILDKSLYIYWDILNATGNLLLTQIKRRIDKGEFLNEILEELEFRNVIEKHLEHQISDDDFRILMIYLERDCSLFISRTKNETRYIKMKYGNPKPSISDEEITIFRIVNEMRLLEGRSDSLEKQVQDITNSLRGLLKQGEIEKSEERKLKAKRLLYKRKNLLRSLQSSVEMNNNLHSIIVRIDDSLAIKQNLDLMAKSNTALKDILEKVDIDELNKLQEEISERIQTVDELSDQLQIKEPDAYDNEVEDELKKLEEEVKGQRISDDLTKEQQAEDESKSALLSALKETEVEKSKLPRTRTKELAS